MRRLTWPFEPLEVRVDVLEHYPPRLQALRFIVEVGVHPPQPVPQVLHPRRGHAPGHPPPQEPHQLSRGMHGTVPARPTTVLLLIVLSQRHAQGTPRLGPRA